ncbi:CRISPR system precrRNA processing endoribonuclease RAMP protein Cas6 [Desulfosarcina sp. OttesenSCG-928-A07]|nr:CRISPR system precrRNA processing endoribonuclease RAMP protein Cas6 [Desulfosarcina sp. OttesenSCG-928-G17]MDL2330004.1 CRISPR system precrRNA processing endoribonuclease RAMP protein Cas6 [Desulfosarcina sp. OttesenSCG-928-A07]
MLPGADFTIACFRFHGEVTSPILLPVYKGSTFHGGFSKALARIGPRFREFFFSPTSPGKHTPSSDIPKPFMLIPPLEEKIRYQPGEPIEWGLMLYGEAIHHFMIAFAAFETLGERLGLGRSQGKFKITHVENLGVDAASPVFCDNTWCSLPPPVNASEILSFFPEDDSQSVLLHFITRLRLKENNQLVRTPPVFSVLMDRLLGRIHSLSTFYGTGPLVSRDHKTALCHLASTIHLDPARTDAHWSEWERPAKSGRDAMSFGGLVGTAEYTGSLAPFLPWLNLGQWTGVGGKTSFGLGKYQMEIKNGHS